MNENSKPWLNFCFPIIYNRIALVFFSAYFETLIEIKAVTTEIKTESQT